MKMRDLIPGYNDYYSSAFPTFRRDFERYFSTSGAVSPESDIEETDKEIILTADLPGLKEEEVKVTLQDDLLTIRGATQRENEKTHKNYTLRERVEGTYHRSFRVPKEIKADQIQASLSDGVLKVVLPKATETKASAAKEIPITRG